MAIRVPIGSTYDGTTAAVTHTPVQVPHVAGDALVMQISAVDNGSVIDITSATKTAFTSAGWTEEENRLQDDTRVILYHKRAASSSEVFPSIDLTTARECGIITAVYPDVPVSYIGDKSVVQNKSNAAFNTVTTTANNSYVMYSYGLHRRGNGFRKFADNGTPNTVVIASGQTGTTNNADTGYSMAYDFIGVSGTTPDSVRQSPGSDDAVKISLEILSNGNNVPVLFTSFPEGANITGYTTSANDDWRHAIVDSGTLPSGEPATARTFDASAVNTTNNTINMPAHGYDEAWVVRIESATGTLPTGPTDNTFAWVRPFDSDNVQLVDCNGNINSTGDQYVHSGVFKSEINITGAGSGTCILRDARMVWSRSGNNIYRFSTSATGGGGAHGQAINWKPQWPVGDNFVGYSREFTVPRDMTDEVFSASTGYSSVSTCVDRSIQLFVDTLDRWVGYKSFDDGISGGGGLQFKQFQANAWVKNPASVYSRSASDLDSSDIKQLVTGMINWSGNARIEANNGMTDPVLMNVINAYGGSPSSKITQQDVMNGIARLNEFLASVNNSRQQELKTSLIIGAVGQSTYYEDDSRSLFVPDLGDPNNAELYRHNITNITFETNAQPGDEISATNTQIGSSAFLIDINSVADATATVVQTGTQFVQGTVTLDSDVDYDRINCVQCDRLIDNGSQVRNSSFGISDVVGADNGFVEYKASNNMQNIALTADTSLTNGHGVINTLAGGTAGSPTPILLNGWNHNNFGANGSLNAAWFFPQTSGYFDIIPTGGSEPTYRTAGAVVNIVTGATYTVNINIPGAEVTIRDGSERLFHQQVSGTSEAYAYQGSNITATLIVNLPGFETIRRNITLTGVDEGVDIELLPDNSYVP